MIERTSDTWIQIEQWAENQIEDARNNLEDQDDDKQRGRIELARELLALKEPLDTDFEAVDYHS